MEPGLDRRHGGAKARGERLAAQPVTIGKQHHLSLGPLEVFETGEEASEILAALALAQGVWRSCGGLEAGRHFVHRKRGLAPYLVERAVADDRRHPGDCRRLCGVEFAGALPDLGINLLQNVLGEITAAQDTERDAEQLAAGRAVKR